jgi:hypothetical protein
MVSSVAGFSTAKVSPARAATNSPLMSILRICDFPRLMIDGRSRSNAVALSKRQYRAASGCALR